MLQLIWLIPLVPLIGVVLNGFWGRRLPRAVVPLLACGVVFAAFLLSAGAVWELTQLPASERYFETSVETWIPLGTLDSGRSMSIDWGFALDPISAVLLLVVTGVGFLIHVYSIGYMAHEPDYGRFFVYLNLFMAMMLVLVLGSNLLVMFVGWEGVGLCSYLLIGFFYDRPFDKRTGLSCADAGRKAFIVNRLGDLAFLIGILYVATEFGTLNFRELNEIFLRGGGPVTQALFVTIAILLFLGACGKSAQIPLYVWLPDAMAGPTPVSALIHAATMVTAGVYMVCRMSALYSASPEAMAIVAAVGAGTALFAATMGITATDIKKVLAYSTVSQLGFMFAAAGVGAYTAAIFHLMTHAFFKALLFLGAGSAMHGLHGEGDIRRMGNLRAKMPITFWTFLFGWLAIAGIFPFAGFFSKDEILWAAWSTGNIGVWGVLAVAALLTAFYMTRLVWRVFFGTYHGDIRNWEQAHESPKTMTVPLILLALLSLVGGFIGIPAVIGDGLLGGDVNILHHWLEPAVTAPSGHGAAEIQAAAAIHDTQTEVLLVVLATVISLIGILLAWRIYRQDRLADRLAKGTGPIYVMLRNLYWVDELYDAVILRPFYAFSRWFTSFDRRLVDGVVNGAGITAEITGQVIKLFQTGLVRNYALMFLLGVVAILYYLAAL